MGKILGHKGKNCYQRKGSFLYSTNGKKYLDFVQGIAVNCLGHSNDYLIKSIYKKSKKLWHVSNAFIIPERKIGKKNNTEVICRFCIFPKFWSRSN